MATYYQVSARFSLYVGKPLLVGMSHNTTNRFVGFLFHPAKSFKSISRVFRTLAQAQKYIDYLYSRYPDSTAPPPTLDANQPPLFSGL
jgi:uncharacterized membrane protein required for colicin V production